MFEGVLAVSKSHWSFSGRYWAGWSATWAGLIAVVVAMPGAPDKRHVPGPATHSVKAAASPVDVVMQRVDFGALPDTAFGDYDRTRDKR